MMAKEKLASGKHARHLNVTAITVGNGVTWKRIASKSKVKGGKGKSASSLDESDGRGPENTSVGGHGLCSFGNQCGDWEWTNCRKV